MFIPIGTDNPLRKNPTANYVLIFLNFAIFFLTYSAGQSQSGLRPFAMAYELEPSAPQLYQFITYAFLHAGWMHIIGNMLFLYIFGNNVNDRLGNLGYLLLYLGGAVFSGIGHSLISPHPVMGASGAVATITGAYMVLFPKTYINVLYLIIFVGTVEVPAIYFILFKLIIFDNIIGPKISAQSTNIAYQAHLAGYLYGFALPMTMLIFKLLPHSHYDLWALVKRWRRKQEYNATISNGYDPFKGTFAVRKTVKVKSASGPLAEQIQELRGKISSAYYKTDIAGAAAGYGQLLQLDEQQTMPLQIQLDIANKLAQNEDYPQAAKAYHLFIATYSHYPRLEQVQLMLGWILSRYLNQPQGALHHLQQALEKLTDPNQVSMCRDEISRLKKA